MFRVALQLGLTSFGGPAVLSMVRTPLWLVVVGLAGAAQLVSWVGG